MVSHWNVAVLISFHSFALSWEYISSWNPELFLQLSPPSAPRSFSGHKETHTTNGAKFFLTSKLYTCHTFSLECSYLLIPILSLPIFHFSSLCDKSHSHFKTHYVLEVLLMYHYPGSCWVQLSSFPEHPAIIVFSHIYSVVNALDERSPFIFPPLSSQNPAQCLEENRH